MKRFTPGATQGSATTEHHCRTEAVWAKPRRKLGGDLGSKSHNRDAAKDLVDARGTRTTAGGEYLRVRTDRTPGGVRFRADKPRNVVSGAKADGEGRA